MGYIDIKIEIWQRLHFKKETDMQELVKRIEEGTAPNWLCEDDDNFESLETLDETEMALKPSDNDGYSTIEVFNNEYKIIWENGDKNI